MRSVDREAIASLVLVLLAGLTSGAFLSRFLAENVYAKLAIFFHWTPTIVLIAVVSLTMTLLHLVVTKRHPDRHLPLRDALSYLPLLLLALYLFQGQVDTLQAGVLLVGSVSLVASLRVVEFAGGKWLDTALLAALFLLPFVLYLLTLGPTVGEHDTFEFQVLSYELGIAHPTGYPLYILLGRLFTLLPLGNLAYRVNLSSAFFAAATVLVLYGTVYHLTKQRSASALAALSFAFTYSFWSQAVVAEVYALNALFVALTSYLLLRLFYRAPVAVQGSLSKTSQRLRLMRRTVSDICDDKRVLIYVIPFVYGLSLTHHRTMLLFAPAAVAYVLLKRPGFLLHVRRILLILTAFLVPLVGIHLYIPFRWWQIHGRAMTRTEFTNLVLGTQFAGALRWDAWFREAARLRMYLRILVEQYPVPALGLALLGLVWLFWPKKATAPSPSWKEGLFVLMAFTAYVLFGLIYYVPDVSLFVIPSHLFIAISLGIGLALLCQLSNSVLDQFHGLTRPVRKSLIRSVSLTLFSLIPLGLVWLNMPRADRSDQFALYNWGRYVLQEELPSGAVILADSEKVGPLHYLQRVEGVRPDTETGVFPDEETNRAELDRRLAEGRAVFLARFLPGLESNYHLRSLGPLVEVSSSMATELPSDLQPLESDFGSKILFLGYKLDSADVTATDPLRITLYWQANQRVGQNYDVRLRLVGPKGHVWQQTRGRAPVNGLYPTGAWRPGEIIPDFHQLDLAGNVPPGRYVLQVGLFPPFGQEGVTHGDSEHDYLPLTQVGISSAAAWRPPVQNSSRVNFGNRIMLLAYDLPATARPGTPVTLTLYWQRIGEVSADYDLALELVGVSGDTVWRSVEPLLFGEYPASHWRFDESLADSHPITIPSTATGQLELRMSLQHPATHQPVPVISRWLGGWQNQSLLTRMQILDLPFTPGKEDLPVNFENKVLLLDYELRNVQVRQGEAVQLSLTWQGLSPIREDYTVFVHLLDDKEQIWGQEDTQPVYGTQPTSQWREGEIIQDPHTVWTDASSPLGLYRLEVGFYLLRTMERLQVVDASATALSDRALLGPVEIVP